MTRIIKVDVGGCSETVVMTSHDGMIQNVS